MTKAEKQNLSDAVLYAGNLMLRGESVKMQLNHACEMAAKQYNAPLDKVLKAMKNG